MSTDQKSSKIKEILQIAYGLGGMVVFFGFLFYGGNKIIFLVGLYYKYLFFVGLPIVAVYWLIAKLKK